MGIIKHPPKYYNPNWSLFSARRKRWENAYKKKSITIPKKVNEPLNISNTKK